MKGCIIERNGSLRLKVSLGKDPQTGKYESYYETFHGNRTEAQKRLRQILTELDKGIFIKPIKVTVSEYLDQWLHYSAYPNLTPRTYEQYEYIVQKYIKPAIGEIPLCQLKPQQLQLLYASKQSEGRQRTAEYIHFTCRKAFANAVKQAILARNPADQVERPRVAHKEIQTMSESEMHIFLEYARTTSYYPIFYLALFTGMRRSELLALKWADVDLLLCQLSVSRSLHQLRYGTYKGKMIFKQPKTLSGKRVIALSPSTVQVLREHREVQDKTRRDLGLPLLTEDDLVFCHYDGKPYLPDNISHAWLKLARHTGVNVHFHDARHTHASLMLKRGIHPKIVQERLGHHSVEVTLDTYSHVAPGLQQAAAAKFDDIVLQRITSESN